MAKDDNKGSAAAETSAEAPAAAAAPASDSRSIILNGVTLADGTKGSEARAAYIRRRWAAGASRSDILKEVRELQGKPDLKYQIIFQATKGHPGGPAPKTDAAAPAATGGEGSGEGATA